MAAPRPTPPRATPPSNHGGARPADRRAPHGGGLRAPAVRVGARAGRTPGRPVREPARHRGSTPAGGSPARRSGSVARAGHRAHRGNRVGEVDRVGPARRAGCGRGRRRRHRARGAGSPARRCSTPWSSASGRASWRPTARSTAPRWPTSCSPTATPWPTSTPSSTPRSARRSPTAWRRWPTTDEVVVLDVPLLVESKNAYPVAGLLVVDVDPEVAVRRLVEHRGMREDDVRARMARQASRAERLARADRVIDNGGTPDALPPRSTRPGRGSRPCVRRHESLDQNVAITAIEPAVALQPRGHTEPSERRAGRVWQGPAARPTGSAWRRARRWCRTGMSTTSSAPASAAVEVAVGVDPARSGRRRPRPRGAGWRAGRRRPPARARRRCSRGPTRR